MKIKKSLQLALLIGLSFFLLYADQGSAESRVLNRPVTLTILPCADITTTYKRFHPLALFLQKEIGSKVAIRVPKDREELSRLISSGETDFVYQPPHVFVQMEQYYSHSDTLASLTPRGTSKQHGLLVVRSDSGISTIEDLRGKSLLFGSEFSTTKTLSAKALLLQHGINYEKDLREFRYGGSCENIALNVFLKAADAGFVCDHLSANLKGHVDKSWPIPRNGLRVIAETEECPTWVFSAMKSADPFVAAQVVRALLSLHETPSHYKNILEDIESRGFAPMAESDLQILRNQFL